ncbi:uncharacterized protein LOC124453098 [Xenia sp. Carnegie-2017]|uniref:uncharacterized protein LOC124453098 n=1 Tax=Xenia sp. Carnegie-2017 TaxID=2897299 RepID=UPI001F042EF4|nr:uncharacterized protein LOC124453098 [Xenia sp. Carnegie-2017]
MFCNGKQVYFYSLTYIDVTRLCNIGAFLVGNIPRLKKIMKSVSVIVAFYVLSSCVPVAGQSTKGNNYTGMCAPVLRLQVAKFPIKVGDNVTIICRVCGRKNIFWFKDNERFGETKRVKWINTKKVSTNPYVVEGRLWIKRVKKRDRGVFTCYALDFFTNIAEKAILTWL